MRIKSKGWSLSLPNAASVMCCSLSLLCFFGLHFFFCLKETNRHFKLWSVNKRRKSLQGGGDVKVNLSSISPGKALLQKLLKLLSLLFLVSPSLPLAKCSPKRREGGSLLYTFKLHGKSYFIWKLVLHGLFCNNSINYSLGKETSIFSCVWTSWITLSKQ